jgi:superfamily II RNA helicase
MNNLEIFNSDMNIENESILQENYKKKFNILTEINFNFDKFQLFSFKSIDNGNNILVSAPTSSGKTMVAEYAIISNLSQNKKIIYTSPIKSLSNEKYKEFKDKNLCEVGLLTGDNKINVDSQLVIMTAEILRNSLYKNSIEQIDCVIMDEVHFINDPDRGKIWEETIIMLQQSVQIIMLSATINNVENFANWIKSIREKKLSLVKSNKRIVPLSYYIYTENELHKISDSTDTFNDKIFFEAKTRYEKIQKERKLHHKSNLDPSYFDKIVKFLIKNDLLQCIFFSFSRNNCEKYASSIQSILSGEESAIAVNMFDNLMRNHTKEYEILPQYIKIKELIAKGICYHHSGIIPILKEVIEIIFRNGFIKVLFATETFAVGVNMPTRTVIFTELTKPDNLSKRFLNTAEFKQMSGRAGRRGKDVHGNVILLPYYGYPELSDLKKVMLQSMPSITSKFNIDYYYVLKSISINSEIFTKSLLQTEQNQSINSELLLLQEYKTKLENMISSYNLLDISDNEKELIKKEYELENKQNEYKQNEYKQNEYKNININIILPKNLQKELKTLKNKNNRQNYNKYVDIKNMEHNLELCEDKIKNIDTYCSYTKQCIIDILIKNNYIICDKLGLYKLDLYKLDLYKLDLFGLISIDCNECNGILLTEMIRYKIFDNLETIADIICILSIFASYKNEKSAKFNKYYGEHFKYIKSITENWINDEIKTQIIINKDFWEITDGYIDVTYEWVNGADIGIIMNYLNEMEEYEGNFVKNMLKIYNICVNFKKMCELLNRMDLVIKMEDIDKKILRDIVNVNSLYLS